MPFDAATVSPEAPAAVEALSTLSRLYCGRCIPGGAETVGEEELARFVAEELSPRFPAGFTVLRGDGGWRDHATGRTITEATVVFEVMHGAEQLSAVWAVARAWKARYRQDAVGLVSQPVAVSFI